MIAHYTEDPNVCEVEGMGLLFARLKRAGVKVGLDTGFSSAITDVILQRLGWRVRGRIDTCVSSDEVARGRPMPDMIVEIMRRVGVAAVSDVAKVGDAPTDLEEGMNAGCGLTVGVTWGTHRREQLERYPHTHLVDTVDELAELLLADGAD
jgi:phosphonatase-like hydrolase